MKKLFCLLMIFYSGITYCQMNFYDYMEVDHFTMEGYLTIPVKMDHSVASKRLIADSVFTSQKDNLYKYADYYIERAHQVDVRLIVVKIIETKYNSVRAERMYNVVDLERYVERNRKEEFTRDTAYGYTIKDDVIDGSPVSLYKLFHVIADYHKLQLELRGAVEQYGTLIDLTLHLKDLQNVLCAIQSNTGYCIMIKDNKLIVEWTNRKDCKLDCKQ